MKAYFYLKDLFNEVNSSASNIQWNIQFNQFKEDNVEKLTSDYFSNISANVFPKSQFEFSNCSYNGTKITACGLVGTPDSWNPFQSSMQGNFSDIVNGENRGDFVDNGIGTIWGLENKFGFDNLAVPTNDISGGGSTGAFSNGAFYVNIDTTKKTLFEIIVKKYNSDLGSFVYENSHIYEYDNLSCLFYYKIQQNSPVIIPYIDYTSFGWLSGGNSGWVNFSCGSTGGVLGDNPIVTKSLGIIPITPKIANSIIGELEGCCYKSPVLADVSNTEIWKNDTNGFLFKRNFSSETILMTLEKNGGSSLGGVDIPLNTNVYGTFYNFGDLINSNYTGYQLKWRNVLILNGEGTYRLKINSNFLTGSKVEYSVIFELKSYSEDRANGTFRIQSIMNGYLRNIDFDFSGLNWVDGLRVEGFFGNRQAEYEEERIIFRNRQVKQIRSELINKYTCQTLHIPSCITDSIIEYHNFGNVILFTDYNKRNHKTTYVQKEVILESIDSIDYKSVTNLAPLQLTYKDYIQNYTKNNC